MPTQKSAAQFFCDFPRAILVLVSLGDAFSLRFVAPSRALRHSCVRIASLTARGTAGLPPEGRQVYRPWDGKFTARGAVSNKSAGKSNGDKGKSDEA